MNLHAFDSSARLLQDPGSGRWLWKNDPEFLRQQAEKGAESYPHLWEVLRRLACPTLLIWGTASDVLSEDQAKRVVRALPPGELAAVPGAPHAPTLTEPESAEALERFLTASVRV
jgi:pimeloyl-ACP methyl ester carboxylesterase